MIRFLYRIYQLFVALPVMLVFSALTSIVTIIGCTLGSAHFWGYYPAMIWSRLMCYVFLLPVRVEGRKHLAKHQSYVFVANHQGPFDIFLVYGFLGRNFKWMMKKSLRHLFLIGKACESAGHIFVDKSGPRAIQQTYRQGREVLAMVQVLWCFQKERVRLPATWVCSEGVPSSWLMNCSLRSYL